MGSDPTLTANRLSLCFSDKSPVVAELDLEVKRGEIVSIIGPSGVGKSSLLRVLAGLQPPANGGVFVNAQPLHKPNPLVALAFQHPALLPWLNVRQNVGFGLDFKSQSSMHGSTRAARAALSQRIDDALAEVGLNDAASKYPDQISGGMAQRAALARCLAREPEVLLLDEPFGALDEVTRHNMQQLLLAARKRHDMAVVLVTHDIDEAILVSDRIALLAGSPANLTHSWQLGRANQALPRDLLDDSFVKLRVEILKALRASMSGRCPDELNTSQTDTAYSVTSMTATTYAKGYAHVL